MGRMEELLNENARKRRKKVFNKKVEIKIDPHLCKSCGLCVLVCPTGVLELVEDRENVYGYSARAVKPEYCTACRLCEVNCPDLAIRIVEEGKDG